MNHTWAYLFCLRDIKYVVLTKTSYHMIEELQNIRWNKVTMLGQPFDGDDMDHGRWTMMKMRKVRMIDQEDCDDEDDVRPSQKEGIARLGQKGTC